MSPEGRRPWAIVVPFALPGEKIRVHTYRQGRLHSYGDLLEVITPNAELRDDSRAQCKYFDSCAGCQYQVGFRDMRRNLPHLIPHRRPQNTSNIACVCTLQLTYTIVLGANSTNCCMKNSSHPFRGGSMRTTLSSAGKSRTVATPLRCPSGRMSFLREYCSISRCA